jgi:hypothetical protein
MEILQPFWELTVQLQGCVGKYDHEGLLSDVIIAIEDLLGTLNEHRIHYEHAPHDHYLSNGVKAAIRLMDKYVGHTRQSSAWAAAVAVYPASKWKDFEDSPNWRNKGEIVSVKRAVEKLWEDNYRRDEPSTSDNVSVPLLKSVDLTLGTAMQLIAFVSMRTVGLTTRRSHQTTM